MAGMGEESVLNILMVTPEGRGPRGRHKPRWEDNIKMCLHGVIMWGIDWIDVAHDRDSLRARVNTLMNNGVYKKEKNPLPEENQLIFGEELFSMDLVSH